MFKNVFGAFVEAVKKSRLGVLLHVLDAIPHLLHHLLLGHGRGDAHIDGVGLPLLTRLTRLLESLNEFIKNESTDFFDLLRPSSRQLPRHFCGET